MILFWKPAKTSNVKYVVVVKVLHQGQKLEVWNMPTSTDKARLIHLYGCVDLNK
jgi:hypothetical protein